jgi:hypothetical protein
MTPALCIADRVQAKDCPCEQCRRVIRIAKAMGRSHRRRLEQLLLDCLTKEVE